MSLPKNANTTRAYSGVNILMLWDALFTRGYDRNLWLTFKEALALGGSMRKGERGTTYVYADRPFPETESGVHLRRGRRPA